MSAAPTPPGEQARGSRRPALWADVALTLALVTLAALVLNAGLFWLVMRQAQQDDRVTMAEQFASYVALALESEVRASPDEPRYRQVLNRFEVQDLDVVELYLVDQGLNTLASVRGKPPRTHDVGFRTAFFSRKPHVGLQDRLSTRPLVVVTWPVSPVGPPVAALRLVMPMSGGSLLESQPVFLLVYLLSTGLVITLAGYVLLRRRLVVPIQQLRRGTARIAAGEFEHRVEVDASSELVALTASLNHLAESLQTYRQRTGDQVERLEEANRALAQAQEDLIRTARLASVGQLAAGIAHEVGNPLAAVVGYVDLLRAEWASESGADSPLVSDLLKRTSRELDRIHHILRDLIDYARPSRDGSGEASVEGTLRETLSTLGYQPGFRELELDIEIEAGLPPVAIQPGKLHQVLVNLLLNAADAMEGRGRLSVAARRERGRVCLTVRDRGPGLEPEVERHLFEPFFTTKPPGSGVGLGLATSQSIAQSVGGELLAANHPEGGAVFTVVLPLTSRGDQEGRQERGPSAAAPAGSPPGGGSGKLPS
jgi:two-component system NtrC family sensor kinase